MANLFFGIAMLFAVIAILSTITQKFKLLVISLSFVVGYLLLLMIANNHAERESTVSVVPTTQVVKNLNSTMETSENVEYHTSDITYAKKTEYRVSKDSPFHLLKGDRVVDTKYDIYLEK